MFRFKIFISILIFSSLLVGTSFVKNQTREIQKKIYDKNRKIFILEKDLNESQLDFYYLSSPAIIELKLKNLDNYQYIPMDKSKIFLSASDFIDLTKKIVINEKTNEKKTQKK